MLKMTTDDSPDPKKRIIKALIYSASFLDQLILYVPFIAYNQFSHHMAISLRRYYCYLSFGYVCSIAIPFFAYSLYRGSSLLTISLAKVAQLGSVVYLFYAYTNKNSTAFLISWILLLVFTTIANIGFNTALFCIDYNTTKNKITGFQGVAKKTFVQNFGIIGAYILFVGLTGKSRHGGLEDTLWVALSMSVINLCLAMAILALLFQEDPPCINFEEMSDEGCISKYQDPDEEDLEGLVESQTTPKKGGLRRSIYKAPKSILNTAPQAERNLTDKKKGVEFDDTPESENSNINIKIHNECPLEVPQIQRSQYPLDVNRSPLDVNRYQQYQSPNDKRNPDVHEYSFRKSPPPKDGPLSTAKSQALKGYWLEDSSDEHLYTRFKARQDVIIQLPLISIDQTLLIMYFFSPNPKKL